MGPTRGLWWQVTAICGACLQLWVLLCAARRERADVHLLESSSQGKVMLHISAQFDSMQELKCILTNGAIFT